MEFLMLWIWLGVFVAAVVLEAITQNFVSIWFAVGALVTLAISLVTPFWVQIIVFCVVSGAALAATRPLVKKLMERNVRYTNTDDFIGRKLKAETDITKFDGGEVKLYGVTYTACLLEESDETIEKGSIVEVVSLKGNKLVVKKIDEKKGKLECF